MAIPLTAREPIEFRPPSLKEAKPDLAITVRVPTMLERDRYGAALVRSGVVFYTQKQIRDFTLAGVQEIYPAETHDEYVALLEEYWLVVDDERATQQAQAEKLIEIYEAAKAKKKDPDPKFVAKELDKIVPSAAMDKQRRVKANGLASEIASRSPPVRDALASLTEADSKRAYLNVQTFVMGWKGLEHTIDGVPGPEGLKIHEAEYLRLQIGEEAWEELSDYITGLQSLTEDEEKNSDSPPVNTIDGTGSTQSEPKSASNEGGNSTDESSSPTPATGSRPTTGSSRKSTKTLPTKKGS